MTTPHIRDLNLPDWHEVPKNATIPAGTRYLCVFPDSGVVTNDVTYDYHAADRNFGARYFTAEPIPDTRGTEIEAEAKRLYRLAYPALDDAWEFISAEARAPFLTLAADSLDRQNKEN